MGVIEVIVVLAVLLLVAAISAFIGSSNRKSKAEPPAVDPRQHWGQPIRSAMAATVEAHDAVLRTLMQLRARNEHQGIAAEIRAEADRLYELAFAKANQIQSLSESIRHTQNQMERHGEGSFGCDHAKSNLPN